MTTSSSPIPRALDTAPIVYSLLSGHPASAVCENYIRNHPAWFTTTVTLLEADAVLRKVYGVDPILAAGKLSQFAAGPVTVLAVDAPLATSAMTSAGSLGIDLADAVLLEGCRANGVSIISTEDSKFAQKCAQFGMTAETPIDSSVRRQIVAWESTHLPAKGLPRLLFHVRQWLQHKDPELAQKFWNETGAGIHLP